MPPIRCRHKVTWPGPKMADMKQLLDRERDARKFGRMNVAELKDNAQKASRLLKAMSNERRLLILCSLSEGELSVGQMEQMVDLSQSALSQHLARLRRDGLVETRRDAQTIYYTLRGDEAQTVIKTLHDLYCGPERSAG